MCDYRPFSCDSIKEVEKFSDYIWRLNTLEGYFVILSYSEHDL